MYFHIYSGAAAALLVIRAQWSFIIFVLGGIKLTKDDLEG